VPWTRRRTLHRLVAERLELRRAPPLEIAEHWLAAREFHRACPALAVASREFCDLHAYRDALVVGRRAIDAWPEGLDEPGRLELVERIGRCAQLAGELPEAIAAWREVADRRRLAGDTSAAADADRQLAVAYDLQGTAELALTARREAARGYARTGRHADAATELLSAAAQLDSAGSLAAALELVDRALAEARSAARRDLEARALGIEGTVRAKLGQLDAGLEAARTGLALALSDDATGAAVDVYQHVANVFENAGDYGAAWDTYQTAYDYCQEHGADSSAQVCLVCLAAILFFTGQWERALELDRTILASPHAGVGPQMGAKQHFGLIHAARGDAKQARRMLDESGAYAERYERQRMEVWDAMGQAWIDDLEGLVDAAIDRCGFILARWGESESVHYPVPALRWATTYLATHRVEREARACAAALARLAADTVNPEAPAGLSHALGETALLDGDPEQAARHFGQALALLAHLKLPYETAQTKLRAGVALLTATRREEGVDCLTDAYRTARKLGARPLATAAAPELAAFGEQVDRRLGRRAAAQLDGPGLTRRELEIVRLVASGRTNREIARDLYLSTRTVDMHVRNVLRKLDSRSRTEATTRAAALGLLP
jgi:ATP/maltotriose-dependent transcriptional regulator MalT